MSLVRLLRIVLAYSICLSTANSEELGPLQAFGLTGRLFSAGKNDYYLLSRQTYAMEEISGYRGKLRIVKKYSNGGYEELQKDYLVLCYTEHEPTVIIS
jgi:hypothetical protein